MSKTLYVGNLAWGTTEEKVRELLGQYGPVLSVRWITDRETGRFRGFCFVEMDDANADKAIKALNGFECDGRALRVNVAEERQERDRRGGRGGSGGGGSGGGRRRSGGYRDRDRDDRDSSW
ncbi:MAG TPA: RNA-binding protein [Anaerolineae bacterium]|nr:RNA-binding protein [Anaerolineae bacterium]HQK13939.1 RNA-binding protein [Anaerolineae bacterium]